MNPSSVDHLSDDIGAYMAPFVFSAPEETTLPTVFLQKNTAAEICVATFGHFYNGATIFWMNPSSVDHLSDDIGAYMAPFGFSPPEETTLPTVFFQKIPQQKYVLQPSVIFTTEQQFSG